MIQFANTEGKKILELGGGGNRQPISTVNVDVRAVPGVDFVVDFNAPDWPIQSDEFDVVISVFCLEHVSWRNVPQFLKETFRVCKPGGKVVFVIPNTEAQMQHLLKTQDWEDAGSMLFGTLDYPENSHRAAFSPSYVTRLFREAGFTKITVQPYGEKQTDMVIQAAKPEQELQPECGTVKVVEKIMEQGRKEEEGRQRGGLAHPLHQVPRLPPEQLYDRQYFNGTGYQPFYWDYPWHENTARLVLARRPESVLELGCGRGYVLKRLQDAGVDAKGIDVSRHCHLTRACDGITVQNLFGTRIIQDAFGRQTTDLCASFSFLEHVPEENLDEVLAEMKRTCKRGLHGIVFPEYDDGSDPYRCTVKPREWWAEKFKRAGLEDHEVLPIHELEQGPLPVDYLRGDGKVKLNVGCYMTMFHHGWTNIDREWNNVLEQMVNQHGYRFERRDVREGFVQATGSVDLIYTSHMLEHLTYKEGLSFLRDCRRVLKPQTGALRVIVPDAEYLLGLHSNPNGDGSAGHGLEAFDQLSEGCEKGATATAKLHALLLENHQSVYDWETLRLQLEEAGFDSHRSEFRQCHPRTGQVGRECLDMLPCVSLYVDAVPRVG